MVCQQSNFIVTFTRFTTPKTPDKSTPNLPEKALLSRFLNWPVREAIYVINTEQNDALTKTAFVTDLHC